jgi:hypothetical protein
MIRTLAAKQIPAIVDALFAELEKAGQLTANFINPDMDKAVVKAVLRGFIMMFVLQVRKAASYEHKNEELKASENELFYKNIKRLVFAPFSHPLTQGLEKVVGAGLPLVLNEEVVGLCLDILKQINAEKMESLLDDKEVVAVKEAPAIQPTLLSRIKRLFYQAVFSVANAVSVVIKTIGALLFPRRQSQEAQVQMTEMRRRQ